MVGPIWMNIPPKYYGGTEDVVYNLINGLVQRHYEVTLFGPKTAKTKAKLHPTINKPLRENNIEWSDLGYTILHLTEAFDHASEFDILHVHLNKVQDYLSLPLALYSKTPVVFTIHFKLPEMSNRVRRDRHLVLKKYNKLPYISISDSQRKPIKLNFVKTVYNSIDMNRFPFSDRKGTYLVWLGKVTAFKGTKDAILAAKEAGIRIYVMGSVEKGVPEMLSYYTKEIKPLCDEKQVIWLGDVSHNEKTSILSGALAFLNPIQWEEPFGLVMVESQAVGTPVISYSRGAAPELIKDGKTGFLVKNLDEMVKKIPEAVHLNRADCVQNVQEHFSIDKMIEGYEEAYRIVIKNWGKYRREQREKLRIES